MYRNLTVTKKTGFRITDITVPVNIRDDRGILFYTTEDTMPVYEFNLPPGKYLVDSGYFKPMEKPKFFKIEPLPSSETFFPVVPNDFAIEFAPNRNKCSIFWKEKLIVFDTKFADAPLSHIYFILFHEYGHSRYGLNRKYSYEESEAYCDLYATNKMLEMGFNPSQINKSPNETLSAKQQYRKDFIDTVLKFNAYARK